VDAVAERMHAAAVRLSRRLRADDEVLGVSAARLSALAVLTAGGPMRIGDLARTEHVEPATMTRLVDAMERDGLVSRAPDATDRRATLTRATPRGAHEMRRERARRVAAFAARIHALPANELAELAQAAEILARAIG
jgi:DNA-binding MarR family transcriptional regulator